MKHEKMLRIDRAAQFAPFNALKGLQQALRAKELENETKIDNNNLKNKYEKNDYNNFDYYDNNV